MPPPPPPAACCCCCCSPAFAGVAAATREPELADNKEEAEAVVCNSDGDGFGSTLRSREAGAGGGDKLSSAIEYELLTDSLRIRRKTFTAAAIDVMPCGCGCQPVAPFFNAGADVCDGDCRVIVGARSVDGIETSAIWCAR